MNNCFFRSEVQDKTGGTKKVLRRKRCVDRPVPMAGHVGECKAYTAVDKGQVAVLQRGKQPRRGLQHPEHPEGGLLHQETRSGPRGLL